MRTNATAAVSRPALRYHGGKFRLAPWIPPYVHATRHMRNKGGYRHELDDAGHVRLIEALQSVAGMVVLSGYASELYSLLSGWDRHETAARISGGRGTSLRTEVVWVNPACSAALKQAQGELFAEAAVV